MPLNLSASSAALAPWSAALHASTTILAPMARVRCSSAAGLPACPDAPAAASAAAGELGCPGEAAAEDGSFSHIRMALFQSPDLAHTRSAPICTSRSGALLDARKASSSCAHAHACVSFCVSSLHHLLREWPGPTTADKMHFKHSQTLGQPCAGTRLPSTCSYRLPLTQAYRLSQQGLSHLQGRPRLSGVLKR